MDGRRKECSIERMGCLKRCGNFIAVATYTGDYLWLCETHYQAAQPKIPDRIE